MPEFIAHPNGNITDVRKRLTATARSEDTEQPHANKASDSAHHNPDSVSWTTALAVIAGAVALFSILVYLSFSSPAPTSDGYGGFYGEVFRQRALKRQSEQIQSQMLPPEKLAQMQDALKKIKEMDEQFKRDREKQEKDFWKKTN